MVDGAHDDVVDKLQSVLNAHGAVVGEPHDYVADQLQVDENSVLQQAHEADAQIHNWLAEALGLALISRPCGSSEPWQCWVEDVFLANACAIIKPMLFNGAVKSTITKPGPDAEVVDVNNTQGHRGRTYHRVSRHFRCKRLCRLLVPFQAWRQHRAWAAVLRKLFRCWWAEWLVARPI